MVGEKEVPNLKEREEAKEEGNDAPESSEEREEESEQSKVQLVTNEQLLNMKLDNISADVQTLTSEVIRLVEIVNKKK